MFSQNKAEMFSKWLRSGLSYRSQASWKIPSIPTKSGEFSSLKGRNKITPTTIPQNTENKNKLKLKQAKHTSFTAGWVYGYEQRICLLPIQAGPDIISCRLQQVSVFCTWEIDSNFFSLLYKKVLRDRCQWTVDVPPCHLGETRKSLLHCDSSSPGNSFSACWWVIHCGGRG